MTPLVSARVNICLSLSLSLSLSLWLLSSLSTPVFKIKEHIYHFGNFSDDDDITPYATFTLKPICGMDTTRSLMSVPSMRAPDSHSSNSIEGDELFIR